MDGAPPQGENGAPQNPATIPADVEALGRIDKDTLSHSDVQGEGQPVKDAEGAPAQSAAASVPPLGSSGAVSDTSPPSSRLTAAEISELLRQGDAHLHNADVTSARLFYERAAAAGDGRGAVRLGATFDPAFLQRAGLRNVQGNMAEAQSWYHRAVDLSSARDPRQLDSIEAK
jgi:hypothetical protein